MSPIIQFYSFVVRLAVALALLGQLHACTLELMGRAAARTQRGIISYSKFSVMLNK